MTAALGFLFSPHSTNLCLERTWCRLSNQGLGFLNPSYIQKCKIEQQIYAGQIYTVQNNLKVNMKVVSGLRYYERCRWSVWKYSCFARHVGEERLAQIWDSRHWRLRKYENWEGTSSPSMLKILISAKNPRKIYVWEQTQLDFRFLLLTQ